MLNSFEQLKDFDPSLHWLSFEEGWVPEAAQSVYEPYIVEKPSGIIGYIIRLFYEYIWKPEALQLVSVVPKFHDYVQILCHLQESGDLCANEMKMHQVAASGLTGSIRQQFNREYTPQRIISYLSSVIDGLSRDITADQFRDWVVENLLNGDQSRQGEIITSDRKFKPQVRVQMLVAFGIFSTTDLI